MPRLVELYVRQFPQKVFHFLCSLYRTYTLDHWMYPYRLLQLRMDCIHYRTELEVHLRNRSCHLHSSQRDRHSRIQSGCWYRWRLVRSYQCPCSIRRHRPVHNCIHYQNIQLNKRSCNHHYCSNRLHWKHSCGCRRNIHRHRCNHCNLDHCQNNHWDSYKCIHHMRQRNM
jgi:hypothetical protein